MDSNTRTLRSAAWGVVMAAAMVLATMIPTAAPASSAGVSQGRLGGSDRYETSVVISRSAFSPGVDTVFVASGENFPDALSAGAAAGTLGGPVLLTRGETLPQIVREELDRLDPQRIVVVGGAGAVSDSVLRDLRSYSANVSRIAGADRYETAAKVSAAFFDVGTATKDVYVASGESFADAIAASAAGAGLHGPVLLTQRDNLPAATDRELSRLSPLRIMVVGGTSAISNSTAEAAYTWFVQHAFRVAGPDRYATSARVSFIAYEHSGADTVYLASGLSFPDALSGAAVAGIGRDPVLLVDPTQVSTAVCTEVQRLQPQRVVALGGPAAVSDAVLNHVATVCAKPMTPPVPPPGPAPTTPTPSPTATPGVPLPGGDTPPAQNITCASFETQRQAQDFYDYWVGKGYRDHYGLDEDGDGTACETLPRG